MSILHRGFVKRYIARQGMSLVQEPGLWDFLDTRKVDLVIDVGANAGQFAREIRSMGYRGRIHSFEPLAAAFAELEGHAARDPLWDVSNVGVGSRAGKLEINIARNSVFQRDPMSSGVWKIFTKFWMPVNWNAPTPDQFVKAKNPPATVVT